MEVVLFAFASVWFTHLIIISSFTFSPSPRSDNTFKVYLQWREQESKLKWVVEINLSYKAISKGKILFHHNAKYSSS